jgi:hypothetical protein
MYSSTFSLTLTLDGNGWSTATPARFTRGKGPMVIVQEAGWPRAGVDGCEKSPLPTPPTEFDPRAVYPVVSRYTE